MEDHSGSKILATVLFGMTKSMEVGTLDTNMILAIIYTLYTPDDVYSPQEAKEWKYFNTPRWITSDDILVNSFKLGTYKKLEIKTFGLGSKTQDVCF